METSYKKTDEEWKKQLTPEQYHVLREKGTERPHVGKYTLTVDKGIYTCAGCGTELFTSDQKLTSECGWPSFDSELGKGEKITKIKDTSYGMIRTEIVCTKCGGHLGHIFDDGPTKTGMRYCVNSLSLDFKPEDKKKMKETPKELPLFNHKGTKTQKNTRLCETWCLCAFVAICS